MQPPDPSERRPSPTADILPGASGLKPKGLQMTKSLSGRAGPCRAHPGGSRSPASRPGPGPSAQAADTPTPPGRSTRPRLRTSLHLVSLAQAKPPPCPLVGSGTGVGGRHSTIAFPRVRRGGGGGWGWSGIGRSGAEAGRSSDPERRQGGLNGTRMSLFGSQLFLRVLQAPGLEPRKMPSGAAEARLTRSTTRRRLARNSSPSGVLALLSFTPFFLLRWIIGWRAADRKEPAS